MKARRIANRRNMREKLAHYQRLFRDVQVVVNAHATLQRYYDLGHEKGVEDGIQREKNRRVAAALAGTDADADAGAGAQPNAGDVPGGAAESAGESAGAFSVAQTDPPGPGTPVPSGPSDTDGNDGVPRELPLGERRTVA